MRKLLLLSALATASLCAAVKTGPEVGAKLPDFQAPDQDGAPRRLSSLLGPKGGILVIYRSADW